MQFHYPKGHIYASTTYPIKIPHSQSILTNFCTFTPKFLKKLIRMYCWEEESGVKEQEFKIPKDIFKCK